jgi:trans-aconitate 2-methyltransferase
VSVSGSPGPVDPAFSGEAYAACTAHHRAHDADVLAPVAWRAGMRVLDVGCGVGDLTGRIADLVAPGDVLGVDSSASQVEHARAGAPRAGLRFEVGRAQELDTLVPAAWADVVVSVAVLHWVPEADQGLVHEQVARALAPGGTFRLDMGGRGQIEDTREVLDEVAAEHDVAPAVWCFPDEATARDRLSGAGLAVVHARLVRQRRRLADAAAIEGWLRSQVLPGYGRVGPATEAFEAFADEAVRRCTARLRREDGSFDQHYVRLDALARRD